jgi:5-methylcytosine-specific restriction endonuclease McrA
MLFPKPVPRVVERQKRRTAEAATLRECYQQVDRRDEGRCRVCGRRCSPTAVAMLDRAERHHLVYRSKGGTHEPANVVTLCKFCHSAVHGGTMRLEGDANAKDAVTGRLAGVRVERQTDTGWRVEKWA